MVARRSILLPCGLDSNRRLRRRGQRATDASSQVPSRRRSSGSKRSNGSSASAAMRLGRTSGSRTLGPAVPSCSVDVVAGGRVDQGSVGRQQICCRREAPCRPRACGGPGAAGARRDPWHRRVRRSRTPLRTPHRNAPRSSIRLTKVSRAAQYSAEVVSGTSCRSACTKLAWPLADTVTPAPRRRATRAAANAARSTPRNSNGVVMGR